MANALTAARLVLVLPMAVAMARPGVLAPGLVALLLGVAIATDYVDGPIARLTGTNSAKGQLFDHSTDCLFVTAGLTGTAVAGLVTPILPILVPLAFCQYVFDSCLWHRQKRLRASVLGRWNGILYFVPLVLIAASRLGLPAGISSWLTTAASTLAYLLVVSTLGSVIDRATALSHPPEVQDTPRPSLGRQ